MNSNSYSENIQRFYSSAFNLFLLCKQKYEIHSKNGFHLSGSEEINDEKNKETPKFFNFYKGNKQIENRFYGNEW